MASSTSQKPPTVTAIRAPTDDIENHTVVLRQLKEVVEMLLGVRGDPNHRSVTLADLVNAGLARNVNGTVQPPGLFTVYEPTSLTATPIPGGIQFTFSVAANTVSGTVYDLLEYTSSTPYTSATVVMSGATQGFVLAKSDTITRYYWVRTRLPNGQTSLPYPVTANNPTAAGVPAAAAVGDNFTGAWSAVTAYTLGDEVTSNGNYYLCTTANTNSVPPNANWQLVGPITLDNVNDGSTYLRIPSTNLDASRRTLAAANNPLGSVVPNVIPGGFTWTSTITSVTISWPSFTVFRADGTTSNVASGNQTITGLSSATTYTIYPYVVDGVTPTVAFASGGANSNGTPASAYSAATASAAAQMYLYGHVPLVSFSAATPSSGSGGGGGGGTGCLHPTQLIELADGSLTTAGELVPGDLLPSPEGPVPIARIDRIPCGRWVIVQLSEGLELTVTQDHRFFHPDMKEIRAKDLKLGVILAARRRNLEVRRLELLSTEACMVRIELHNPHLYYVLDVLSHNPKP